MRIDGGMERDKDRQTDPNRCTDPTGKESESECETVRQCESVCQGRVGERERRKCVYVINKARLGAEHARASRGVENLNTSRKKSG